MRALIGCYPHLAVAGFHRYSTYRSAAVAALTTNTAFGLMRIAVLFSVLGSRQQVAGYDAASIASYVWLGQGLLGVVILWGGHELADRVRSGDVAVDLARPWNLQFALLAEDYGRAGFAMLIRFVPPMLIGGMLFDLRWPQQEHTWALFALSIVLAVAMSFAIRFLLSLSAFWLLDARGVTAMYGLLGGIFSGLTVPLAFFPDWAYDALWWTPFPSLLQNTIDVFVERGSPLPLLAHQALWTVGLLVIGQLALRAAERKLVVQGG
ncbi:ABC-2 family transporter protein [Allokutzneria sp. A3M-2-11 16]|uniref:ABC transporter permease n=1 Tax=Allokutzneria sp. A3M-2-11 16 TaxID=2962043 RepID=UPI0020B88AEA|nr:ABC-2 family transporter protein [Allokutzneria sp. A3M-2-11 16]MCP3800301.1 ABC-2 family transporter protein [Allokutzneria sp. A3M-2-11 16]